MKRRSRHRPAVILGLVPRIYRVAAIRREQACSPGPLRAKRGQPKQILGTSPRMTALSSDPGRPYAIALHPLPSLIPGF